LQADIRVNPEQVIATLLLEEFGVGDGTHQKTLLQPVVVVKEARKLDVADAHTAGCHLAAAEHFKVGRTDDRRALHAKVGIGVAVRVRCDHRLSMQLLDATFPFAGSCPPAVLPAKAMAVNTSRAVTVKTGFAFEVSIVLISILLAELFLAWRD
jgi:hypothetical protein